MLISVVEILILFGFLFLAFWVRDMILYIITGVISIIVGARWMDEMPGISVMLFGLAVYLLILGLLMPFQSSSPAKGLSHFKALWERAKKWRDYAFPYRLSCCLL